MTARLSSPILGPRYRFPRAYQFRSAQSSSEMVVLIRHECMKMALSIVVVNLLSIFESHSPLSHELEYTIRTAGSKALEVTMIHQKNRKYHLRGRSTSMLRKPFHCFFFPSLWSGSIMATEDRSHIPMTISVAPKHHSVVTRSSKKIIPKTAYWSV